jgi:hypothetical protein
MNRYLENVYCNDCKVHVIILEYANCCANCLGKNLDSKH